MIPGPPWPPLDRKVWVSMYMPRGYDLEKAVYEKCS